MYESYISKYYSLSSIPSYRREYIDIRLEWFLQNYGLTIASWPIDCVKLLKEMKDTQKIPFTYGLFNLPAKYDAITSYEVDHDVYIMQINKGKVRCPYEYSRDRRLNFTLAHEIGHIVLQHLIIPRNLKTPLELALEEEEANEFAGRLLMPEDILLNCNFYSFDKAARYFIVSNSALWKRLNNIKRLDLLQTRSIPCCPVCGNTLFTVFTEYCGICGYHHIENGLKGIRRIYYPIVHKTDRFGRVEICPKCKRPMDPRNRNCPRCGTSIFNTCTENCEYPCSGSHRYCEMCGSETHYFKEGLIKPWYEVSKYSADHLSDDCKWIEQGCISSDLPDFGEI